MALYHSPEDPGKSKEQETQIPDIFSLNKDSVSFSEKGFL